MTIRTKKTKKEKGIATMELVSVVSIIASALLGKSFVMTTKICN